MYVYISFCFLYGLQHLGSLTVHACTYTVHVHVHITHVCNILEPVIEVTLPTVCPLQKSIFEGIAQEALSECVKSLCSASTAIESKKVCSTCTCT